MQNREKLNRAAARFDFVLRQAHQLLGTLILPKVVLLHHRLTPERCFYCGDAEQVYSYLRPKIWGGRRTPGNIVPACDRCANLKGCRKPRTFRNRFPERFPLRRFWAEIQHDCSLAEMVEIGNNCELQVYSKALE